MGTHVKPKEEYHKADVELREFLEACDDQRYSEDEPNGLLLAAVVTFVVALEMTLVFYFLGENLGTDGAFYASITAIVFIGCSATGAAFCHANTSRNLSVWRRCSAWLGMLASFGVFLYSVGILSSWRADSVSVGLDAVMEGYRAIAEVPVFVTALVNFAGFALLAREVRRFFWARYWGYRPVQSRYDKARKAAKEAKDAEEAIDKKGNHRDKEVQIA